MLHEFQPQEPPDQLPHELPPLNAHELRSPQTLCPQLLLDALACRAPLVPLANDESRRSELTGLPPPFFNVEPESANDLRVPLLNPFAFVVLLTGFLRLPPLPMSPNPDPGNFFVPMASTPEPFDPLPVEVVGRLVGAMSFLPEPVEVEGVPGDLEDGVAGFLALGFVPGDFDPPLGSIVVTRGPVVDGLVG